MSIVWTPRADRKRERGEPEGSPLSIHPIHKGSAWSHPVDGYQVPPVQPPDEPVQVSVVSPLTSLEIENVFPVSESAVTV
jgi:hypothetical protein